MSRPPPLQLLPAFEAAARLLSFSKAAAELHLTASAVSQQVKQLEQHLGMSLFHRLTRRVELTAAGAQFAEVAARTLDSYRNGHAELLQRHSRPVLKLSTFHMVAHELIIPGLADFQTTHPAIDLHLDISLGLADFETDGIDGAVRCGTGPWPGLEALPLSDCEVTLVAAPELIRRLPVNRVEDLSQHTLIHPRGSHLDWDAVAAYKGLKRIERKRDLVLDSDLASMQAAEQGLGVAICFLPVCQAWVDAGRVAALMPPVPVPMKNQFVFRPSSAKRAHLMDAYRWIKQRFDALPRTAAGAGQGAKQPVSAN